MKVFPNGPDRRRSGFSLIEILIATTILLVIVVLASLVFQQMTGAYQTGERKMDSQVILRNVIGAITRDLALAVDSEDYPGLEDANSFGQSQITFLALTGTPGVKGDTEIRTLQKISYSYGGSVVKRTVWDTTYSGGDWAPLGDGREAALNDSDQNPIADLEFVVEGDDVAPDRVYIRAKISTGEKIKSVGAGSRGRDGEFGTDDDIYVGLRPRN